MLHGSALYCGAVLGTGVLVLPSLAMQLAGPAAIVAWASLILLSIPIAATFAVLGAKFPEAGGAASFARRAFGRTGEGVTGWVFYGGVMLGTPSAAMMGGIYMVRPFAGGNLSAVITAAALYLVVAGLVSRGARTSSGIQLAVTALLASAMLAVSATALPHADVRNLTPFTPHGWLAVGQAASLLMFAFVGWEAVSPMTSDFRCPERDVPRATVLALALTSFLYLMLAGTLAFTTKGDAMNESASLISLLALSFGRSADWIMAVVATLLTLGALIAYIGGGAKLGTSLSNAGFLPRTFRGNAVTNATSGFSLILLTTVALLVFVLIAAFPRMLQFAVHASAACFTTVYVLGCGAAIRLLSDELFWRKIAWTALLLSFIPLIFAGKFLLVPLFFGLLSIAGGAVSGR